ncbi:MAG: DUF503 domain-containing protein [Gemmatimonadaceae bacterium]|nr:DUF503 domain-containing protein [Gemmatimonadaceae bacterium]
MIIAAITWDLHVPASHSLKEKRSVLSRVKARLRNEFNVSVAETGSQDTWQRAELTACLVAGDRRHAESVLESLDRVVASSAGCRIIDSVRTFF